MDKKQQQENNVLTIDDFDKKYFPDYYEKKQREKDYQEAENQRGKATKQNKFSTGQ